MNASDRLIERLAESMFNDRLVVLCGAGLSMSPPSDVMSAPKIARECYDRYSRTEKLPKKLAKDLGRLAKAFADSERLENVFFHSVVDWDWFARPPNRGHQAIADFLLCRGVTLAISTNFDYLIERAACDWDVTLRSALDVNEAEDTSQPHSPFVKLHGCAVRQRNQTVWAASQLDPQTALGARITELGDWLSHRLRQKDLILIGFWTDWAYLNSALSNALAAAFQLGSPVSLVVVDPATPKKMQRKAPYLWQTVQSSGATFHHVRLFAHEFLDRLRLAFGRRCLNYIWSAAQERFPDPRPRDIAKFLQPPSGESRTLFEFRRNAEGMPRPRPPKEKRPKRVSAFAYCHYLLRKAGAAQDGAAHRLAGRRIRVVNGVDRTLARMQGDYAAEPPHGDPYDIVICAGADDLGLPTNIVKKGEPGNPFGPAPSGRWLTLEQAVRELKLG